MKSVLPHLTLAFVKILRATCRVHAHNDPRDRIRQSGGTYIYAGLHAQQVAMVTYAEPGAGSLVSRSKDGDLIARAIESTGAVPIRGSAGASRKGGAAALRALVNHVAGGRPACLAVDGPKGPRGIVNPGIAMLSQKTNAPVLPVAIVPRWRIIIKSSWDRAQVALPFSRIDGTFSEPIYPRDGESVRDYADRIQSELLALERRCDPKEAAIAQSPMRNQSVALPKAA